MRFKGSAEGSVEAPRVSRARRVTFVAWISVVSVVLGVGFFGLTSLVLGWFEADEGTLIPVTDLGYGALVGILITVGLLVQLRSPERKIAGLQQAALGAIALLISAPLAEDSQNLVPGLIGLALVGIAAALHPARGEFFKPGQRFGPAMATIAVLGAAPLIGYALTLAAQARELVGPPHHIQRLTTMAALAIALLLVALLAAVQTRGWRIPAWSAAAAVTVFGLASVVFPDYRGSAGHWWGAAAIAGGLLIVVTTEWQARRAT